MSRDELMTLASKVETLAGACRETDALVALAKGWQETPNGGWFTPPGLTVLHHKTELPRYTASIDAAMTLVPEGWRIVRLSETEVQGIPPFDVLLSLRDGGFGRGKVGAGFGNTPALALTAAALRAIAAQVPA